jgi:hypothetical protein
MTHDEAYRAFNAAMDAHREMFGFCDGPPYACDLADWVQALQEAVAAGKPVDTSRFYPADPNDLL